MVNFKVCVRNVASSGFYPVYIRITHRAKVGYMKTSWMVGPDGVGRDKGVTDPFVLEACSRLLVEYVQKLNGVDVTQWSVAQVRRFLEGAEADVSFSAFARYYIDHMIDEGSENNAKLYMSALRSLEGYCSTENVTFGEITHEKIEGWLLQLRRTKRARSLYPMCMRMIFNKALRLSAEPGSRLPRLRYNPWENVKIPESEVPQKKAITVEECRRFFNFEIGGGKGHSREELGRDVALLSFCLAGINTVDLYGLRKKDLRDGVISYHRSKTRTRRKDGAYFEIRVNDVAMDIIGKYRAGDDSEMLLRFADVYEDARSFNAVVNAGIRRMCRRMGIGEEDEYSFYTFRHTWATIAMNECGASLSEVGFAMNHNNNAVTRNYIKADFAPAWRLNERVWGVVFGQNEHSERVALHDDSGAGRLHQDAALQGAESDDGMKVVPEHMIYARAYFRGDVIAEAGDIGFGCVDDVVDRLVASFPAGIPDGGRVHFRLKDVDSGEESVFERQKKGKGFN